MKIKRYNKESDPVREIGRPALRLTKKGLICFNQSSMAMIGLEIGDGVEFIQDEDNSNNWYLITSNSEVSFRLREYKCSARISSKTIALSIFKSVPNDLISICLLISKTHIQLNNEKLWPILTSSYKQYKRS